MSYKGTYRKALYKMLRQLKPEVARKKPLWCWSMKGLFSELSSEFGSCLIFPIGNEEELNTVAYCERAYKRGYTAVINDGHLLGFIEQ